MQKNLINFLAIIGIFLNFEYIASIAKADTISYSSDSVKTIQNVIVLSNKDSSVEYVTMGHGCLKKELLSSPAYKNVKVTRSPDEEKKTLIDSWKKQASSAVLKRTFGPSVNIACFGVRYPLPQNVTYYMGGPTAVEGPEIYIGKDSSDSSKVFFKEMESIDIQNGKTVHIKWKNSESSDGALLHSWKYDDRSGAPAVLFGMDMDTLTYIELPLKNIRSITMKDQKEKQ